MPINKPELQSHTRMFTQQDFLDGKCTKEGFPIEKGADPEPEQPTTSSEPTDSQPQADSADVT